MAKKILKKYFFFVDLLKNNTVHSHNLFFFLTFVSINSY